MGQFNLDDYEPVADRLKRFWEAHPKGRVSTSLRSHDEKRVVMVAMVYREADDPHPAATGHAEEIVGSNPITRTSATETCETSAIGRALANMNFASRNRASREEMAKVNRQEQQQDNPARDYDPATVRSREFLLKFVEENQLDAKKVGLAFLKQTGEVLKDCHRPAVINEFGKWLRGHLDEFRASPE